MVFKGCSHSLVGRRCRYAIFNNDGWTLLKITSSHCFSITTCCYSNRSSVAEFGLEIFHGVYDVKGPLALNLRPLIDPDVVLLYSSTAASSMRTKRAEVKAHGRMKAGANQHTPNGPKANQPIAICLPECILESVSAYLCRRNSNPMCLNLQEAIGLKRARTYNDCPRCGILFI